MEYKKQYLAEFFGTFLLLLFASGFSIINSYYGGIIPSYGSAVVSGLAVWLLIQFFGRVADCHINPAVTICFFVDGAIPWQRTSLYFLLQLLGSYAASLLLHFIFPSNRDLGNTLPSGTWHESFIYEFILSLVLMVVILVTTSLERLKPFSPFLIGLAVFFEIWLAGAICGASMNPARSFGPAIVSGTVIFLWLYFVAPIAGMLTGLFLCRLYKK